MYGLSVNLYRAWLIIIKKTSREKEVRKPGRYAENGGQFARAFIMLPDKVAQQNDFPFIRLI